MLIALLLTLAAFAEDITPTDDQEEVITVIKENNHVLLSTRTEIVLMEFEPRPFSYEPILLTVYTGMKYERAVTVLDDLDAINKNITPRVIKCFNGERAEFDALISIMPIGRPSDIALYALDTNVFAKQGCIQKAVWLNSFPVDVGGYQVLLRYLHDPQHAKPQ